MKQPYTFILGYVNEINCPQNPCPCPFHRHEHMEIVYHARGSGSTNTRDGERFTFSAASATVYPPGVEHDQLTRLPAVDICIHVRPAGSPPAVDRSFHIDSVTNQFLVELIYELSRARPNLSKAERAYYDCLCSALMAGMLILRDRTAVDGDGAPRHAGHAQRAYELIRERYGDAGVLDRIAEETGVGHGHLRRVFERTYGISLKQCLLDTRIQRAKDLLLRSQLPLKAVAAQCGYATGRYFCTSFRRRVGMTPGQYRRAFLP